MAGVGDASADDFKGRIEKNDGGGVTGEKSAIGGLEKCAAAEGEDRGTRQVRQNEVEVMVLDGTEAGEPVYRALGFSTLTRMTRWVRAGAHGAKTPVSTSPPALQTALRTLDSAAFGAPRSFLLDDFLSRPNAGAWSDDKSAVVLRPGRHAWQIGPVIGTPDRARALLTRAIDTARGAIVIDLLEAGADLTPWLTQRGFTPRRGFCRMAHGRDTLPGAPARLLAAAGPEFG